MLREGEGRLLNPTGEEVEKLHPNTGQIYSTTYVGKGEGKGGGKAVNFNFWIQYHQLARKSKGGKKRAIVKRGVLWGGRNTKLSNQGQKGSKRGDGVTKPKVAWQGKKKSGGPF